MSVWKDVVGYEGHYQINSHGDVWSVERVDAHGVPRGGHLMAQQESKQGYMVVHLRKDGATKLRKVHQLVLEAFVGGRNADQIAMHRDGNRTNNSLCNLAWGSHRDNAVDRDAHGRTARGERNGGGGRLCESDAREIKARSASIADLASEYGVSKGMIRHIKKGRAWRHA